MLSFFVLLAVGTALADTLPNPPPYVQSKTAFTHTRLYLQQRIPRESRDISDPEARKHVAFGIVTAVTASIAANRSQGGTEHDSLAIFDHFMPLAWENYNVVAAKVNQILAEANLKIQPITNLIDALCTTTDSVEQCNILVRDKVGKSNPYIQHRATLLLHLGSMSNIIAHHEIELDRMARDYMVVPYLLKQIQSAPYHGFVNSLAQTFDLLRKNVAQLY